MAQTLSTYELVVQELGAAGVTMVSGLVSEDTSILTSLLAEAGIDLSPDKAREYFCQHRGWLRLGERRPRRGVHRTRSRTHQRRDGAGDPCSWSSARAGGFDRRPRGAGRAVRGVQGDGPAVVRILPWVSNTWYPSRPKMSCRRSGRQWRALEPVCRRCSRCRCRWLRRRRQHRLPRRRPSRRRRSSRRLKTWSG